jgi:leader peptidase (prepilin peptidase)/N-methyltransferase
MYVLVHVISPTAMGAGDVKLAIGIGALTASFGSDVWLLAALGAPLLSAGLAIGAVVLRSAQTVAHGPSMCLAAAIAIALAVV